MRVSAQNIKADLKPMGLLLVFLVCVQYPYCQQNPTYSLCSDEVNLFLQLEAGDFRGDTS